MAESRGLRDFPIEEELGKLTHIDQAEQSSQPNSVHSLGTLAGVRHGTAVCGGWHFHNPGGVICAPLSSLETSGLLLGADIPVCHGKCFH